MPEADDIDDDVDIDRLSSEPSAEIHGHHDKFEDFKGQDLGMSIYK